MRDGHLSVTIAFGFVRARRPSGPPVANSQTRRDATPIVPTHRTAHNHLISFPRTEDLGCKAKRHHLNDSLKRPPVADLLQLCTMISNFDREPRIETHVEDSKIVDRDHSTLQLSSNFQAQVLMRSKNTGSKAVFGTISNFDRFVDIIIAYEQSNWRKH